MSGDARRATDLASRISGLSPEKQALLARKLAARASVESTGQIDRIDPRDDDAPAPLSHAQELLWLYEQMTPGTAAYNVPMARRVRGPLDIDALRAALDVLVARHESLRTSIVEIDGEPRQVVNHHAPLSVEIADLRDEPMDAREVAASDLLREWAARPFDLSESAGPRVCLVRIADDVACLLLVVHHIVFDGASAAILLEELAIVYEAICAGGAPTLAPMILQPADFALWERRTSSRERFAPAITFWRELLHGMPSGIDLPRDFVPRPGAVGAGAQIVTTLSSARGVALGSLAASYGVTPFMVLLAAFQVLLHRYTGQADISVGTSIAGRTRPEAERMIGYLANTVALPARFDADMRFDELLLRVRTTVTGAFAHADVPYEMLVSELRSEAPAEERALFRVMLTLQDGSNVAHRLGGATLEPLRLAVSAAKFDLSVSATRTDEGLRLATEYRSDLFARETIERLMGHFDVVLEAVTRNPRMRVASVPLMTDAEKMQVLRASAGTVHAEEGSSTLDALVWDQIRRTPDALAVSAPDGRLSFRELGARASVLAERLRNEGVDRGTLVGVLLERSVDMVVAMLGILRAGGVYVPVDPDYPAERIAYMLADANAALVVTHSATASLSPEQRRLDIDSVHWRDAGEQEPVSRDGRDLGSDGAYVIYTSGSTGAPKGVVVPHSAIVNHMRWMSRALPLRADDRVLQKTPVSFDASVSEFWAPLVCGARLVMAPRDAHRDPARLVSVIQREEITFIQLVPSVLAELIDTPGFSESRTLRLVLCGGERLPRELVEQTLRALDVEVHNLYGPAEATIDATIWSAPAREQWTTETAVTIGRPIDNVVTYVLSSDLQLQPIGSVGELFIGGAGVAIGYHGRPALTTERFMADPFTHGSPGRMYRTGDRARWRSDGNLEYLGRLDEQVKVRGVRIELGEIEAALLAQPGVTAAAAAILGDQEDLRLIGYVVTTTEDPPEAAALRTAVARLLPSAMVPSQIVRLDRLPLSPSGKLDRRALPMPELADSIHEMVGPRSDIEAVVAGIWMSVLHVDRVGVETSFFDLGGHSLLATRIVSKVSRIFRVALPLRQFFEAPTVAGIARALAERERKPGMTMAIARALHTVQQREGSDHHAPSRSHPPGPP